MSAESYRAFYAINREQVLRTQAVRRRAEVLGLRVAQSREHLSMYDPTGQLVISGSVGEVEHFVTQRFRPRRPGSR